MTGERGSASLLVVGLLPLVLLVAALATGWTVVIDLRHRASAAADQAALAGAMARQAGADPCAAAARLAVANAAAATACEVEGTVVRVVVRVGTDIPVLGRPVAVTVSARAAAGAVAPAAP